MLLMLLMALCATCTALSVDEKPGFRIQISQKGVEYARGVLLPKLKEAIRTMKIEDIDKTVNTPIGQMTFRSYNARIADVDISQTALALGSPSNLIVSFNKALIAAGAQWHYRRVHFPHISDHGKINISASQISINVSLNIGRTVDGKPNITYQACSTLVNHINVIFSGGYSWLYNLFNGSVSAALKSTLESQACPKLRIQIEKNLNKALESLDLHSDIDDYCYIDYSLVEAPSVIHDAFIANGKGEIFDKSNPSECPSPKQDMPETVDSDRMVTLWITEYMLNTAGYAYQRAGFLQYNLTNDDIPDDGFIKFKLNTTVLKPMLPELYQHYPNKILTIWIYVTKPITFDINEAGVSGRAEGTITWLVHVNDTLVPAFTLDAQLDLCVNLSVHLGSKSEVYLDLITVEPSIQLKKSNIGKFSIKRLQSFLKMARFIIKEFVNGKVKHGIPLPSIDHVSFSGFQFTLENGYIEMHSDIIYIDSRTKFETKRELYTLFPHGFECKIRDHEYHDDGQLEETSWF